MRLGLLSLDQMVASPDLVQADRPPRYRMPSGFEVFVKGLPVPRREDFEAMLENKAWQFFMQQVMAKVYDIRHGMGFAEEARRNELNLLLSEGLAMVLELFNTFEQFVREEDADQTAAQEE